ncbi:hypothetical protein NQZ79_g5685 [Umbelopsis isabellina]|nr:hypothetical protein NQZ79_g5685 [Umbelopsis isabellina]
MTANERCGSWYIQPQQTHKRGSAYFKSTDGHTGQWKFNLRRMNLHLLDIIQENGGCLIVDSTRRGKRLPDALSKTIPIWCAVINRVISKSQYCASKWDSALYTLPSIISRSEHAQIEILIDDFSQNMLNTGVNVDELCKKLKKPLRPIWITPQSTFVESPDYSEAPFLPVICLSASQVVEGGSQARYGYMYVQGSGDDEEAWSLGLSPQLFWDNKDELLGADSATCETIAKNIVESSKIITERNLADAQAFSFVGNSKIAIGTWSSGKPEECWTNFDVVINCTEHEYEENKIEKYKKRYLHLNIPASKRGQHELFKCIPTAIEFCKEPIRASKTILVHCAEGKDRAVGIALALLVRYYGTNCKVYDDISQTPEGIILYGTICLYF